MQTPIAVSQSADIQPNQNFVVNPLFNRHISKQLNLQQALGAHAAVNQNDAANRAVSELLQFNAAGVECNEQIAPNETILQLVAQIPNHPLQKMAQRLIAEPRIGTECKSSSSPISSKTSSNSKFKN